MQQVTRVILHPSTQINLKGECLGKEANIRTQFQCNKLKSNTGQNYTTNCSETYLTDGKFTNKSNGMTHRSQDKNYFLGAQL